MIDVQKRGLEEEERRLKDQSQELDQFNMQVSQPFDSATFESCPNYCLACNQVQEQSRVAQERQTQASAEMSKASAEMSKVTCAPVLFECTRIA